MDALERLKHAGFLAGQVLLAGVAIGSIALERLKLCADFLAAQRFTKLQ